MYYVKFISRSKFLNQRKKIFIFNICYLYQDIEIIYLENDVKKSFRRSI